MVYCVICSQRIYQKDFFNSFCQYLSFFKKFFNCFCKYLSFSIFFSIAFDNIYLFSIYFSITFANIHLFSIFALIDFACWKSVWLFHIAFIMIHNIETVMKKLQTFQRTLIKGSLWILNLFKDVFINPLVPGVRWNAIHI